MTKLYKSQLALFGLKILRGGGRGGAGGDYLESHNIVKKNLHISSLFF